MLHPEPCSIAPSAVAHRASRRSLLAVGVAMCLGAGLGSPVAAAAAATSATAKAPVSDANSVIAAYLVNFLRYVEWPENVPPAGEPWRIGVLNFDGLPAALARMTEAKTVKGRPIAVMQSSDIAGLRDCHLVMLGKPELTDNEAAAKACSGRPQLTVVYHENAAATEAAVIELVLQGRKIRYRLNAALLTTQGLKPTPGLLENALPPAAPVVRSP